MQGVGVVFALWVMHVSSRPGSDGRIPYRWLNSLGLQLICSGSVLAVVASIVFFRVRLSSNAPLDLSWGVYL